MKKNRTAFILGLVAGLLCISTFVYKYIHSKELDYPILFAGIFIVSFGYSMRNMAGNEK